MLSHREGWLTDWLTGGMVGGLDGCQGPPGGREAIKLTGSGYMGTHDVIIG